MAVTVWRGGATPIAQVIDAAPDTPSVGDVYAMTINGSQLSYTATTTDAQDVVDALVTLIGQYNNSIPEWREVSAADSGSTSITITGPTTGKPITVTDTSSGAGSPVITVSTTTAATGPNHWDNAGNWDTGAVPVNSDDVYFSTGNIDCLYGLAQSAVTLDSLNIESGYTGRIGLKNFNGSYYEYRPTMLAIGATALNVGSGEGSGSSRVKIDLGSVQSTANVRNTSTAEDQQTGALVLAGTHASNSIVVNKGSVGIATNEPEQSSTFATVFVGFVQSESTDSNVLIGSGVAAITTLTQSGGVLTCSAPITTFVQRGGTMTYRGTSAIASADIRGTTYYSSTGTITAGKLRSGGTLSFNRDARSRTVTNLTIYAGSTMSDRFRTVTWTNPIVLEGCGIEDCTLEAGTNITIAVATGS